MVSEQASKLHHSSIVIDTHCDSLGFVLDSGEDLGVDKEGRQVTLPKMREGGVTAQFFAAWVDPGAHSLDKSVRRTLGYIDAMNRVCAENADQIELARTAADIRRLKAAGKLAAVLCIEGGHSIDDDLGVLRVYHELGVRYMTLTWNNTNNWADGVLDEPRHGGLTDFGRDVVREMNRLGIMVDISHVAPKTFWDAMETTSKPVIASHSSALAICKHPRNMNDDQLRAVAENGGVADVTFVTNFVSERLRLQIEELGLGVYGTEGESRYREVANELAIPSYTEVVDHIDHMVQVAGIDHVGLGADFGVLFAGPVGMEDCSKFPWITDELLKRGYAEDDVRKILGENVLRVMEAVIGE